jgi:hypothetical protein
VQRGGRVRKMQMQTLSESRVTQHATAHKRKMLGAGMGLDVVILFSAGSVLGTCSSQRRYSKRASISAARAKVRVPLHVI